MHARTTLVPPARLALVFHAPTVARVEVVFRRAPVRLVHAFVAWLLCWGAIPVLAWIPPHYPWVAAAFVAGVFLPYRIWTGRYTVVSFFGFCPRCGKPLALRTGSRIDLPHTLTCFGCHFEPVLEAAPHVRRTARSGETITVEHRRPDCTGAWREERGGQALRCERCNARHCATADARRAARLENERGELLRRLADEGRFLH
jgi:hypothetical protein